MILVPIKNLADAKQRLSSILSSEERFALAQAMCEDVLQALANWRDRPAVAVVTSDRLRASWRRVSISRSWPTTTPERPTPSKWRRRFAESVARRAPWWFQRIFP